MLMIIVNQPAPRHVHPTVGAQHLGHAGAVQGIAGHCARRRGVLVGGGDRTAPRSVSVRTVGSVTL